MRLRPSTLRLQYEHLVPSCLGYSRLIHKCPWWCPTTFDVTAQPYSYTYYRCIFTCQRRRSLRLPLQLRLKSPSGKFYTGCALDRIAFGCMCCDLHADHALRILCCVVHLPHCMLYAVCCMLCAMYATLCSIHRAVCWGQCRRLL